MSLKEFLQEVEKHACGKGQNQEAFVRQFLDLVESEKDVVSS
jgi:hypothetical protein